MKNSFKIAAIALAFSAFAFGAKAQTTTTSTTTSTTTPTGIRYSIGVDAGLPTGNLSDSYNWSIGGSLQADIPVVSNQLFVTVNAGYDNFFGKNDAITITSPEGTVTGTASAPYIQLLPVKPALTGNNWMLVADETVVTLTPGAEKLSTTFFLPKMLL